MEISIYVHMLIYYMYLWIKQLTLTSILFNSGATVCYKYIYNTLQKCSISQRQKYLIINELQK